MSVRVGFVGSRDYPDLEAVRAFVRRMHRQNGRTCRTCRNERRRRARAEGRNA